MSTDFEARLGQELRRVGIHGRLRGRILAEYADHLACDPEAQLGEPGALARQFADEVGSTRARRAAVTAFAALALAGVLFAAAFVTSVLSGIVTMVSLGTIAIAYQGFLSGAWVTFTIAVAAVGTAGLLASLPSIWEAARLRPVAAGEAGDIFNDLGDSATLVPPPLRGRPWRLAAVVSVAVAVVITLVAVPAQDAFDGAARGLADALLCLAGFATLGRYLGLWSPGRAHGDPQAVRIDR